MYSTLRNFAVKETEIEGLDDFLRDKLNLNDGDEVEIVCNPQYITVTKSGIRCFVCGSDRELQVLGNGRHACAKCLRAINRSIEKSVSQ